MTVLTVDYDRTVKERIRTLVGGKRIRLASGSPRRQDILRKLGLEFEVYVTDVDEEITASGSSDGPVESSVEVTKHKAVAGSDGFESGLVIAADTIVVLDGSILSKPTDREEAVRHLRRLRNNDHFVYTSIVLRSLPSGEMVFGTAESRVTFRHVSDSQIEEYVATGESDDKAGAYGIQGMGKFLVDRYTGSLDNIIGFPASLFADLLERI